MAFNIATFKERALTAVIFAAIMLTGLLINQWTFLILVIVIHVGAWLEYQKLIKLIYPKYAEINALHKYAVICIGLGFLLFMCGTDFALLTISLHTIGYWIMTASAAILLIAEAVQNKKVNIKNIRYSILGLLYISLSLGLWLSLYNARISEKDGSFIIIEGIFIPILILACMWVNDTMAYIVGSFIGKTPFSKISPKKTWEGTIGGAILCTLFMGWMASNWYTKHIEIAAVQISNYHWYIIAAVAAITGTVGDLLESKIKRIAGVKDSGTIMPGHGGFLDRFDSLLIAVPIIWLYIMLFI